MPMRDKGLSMTNIKESMFRLRTKIMKDQNVYFICFHSHQDFFEVLDAGHGDEFMSVRPYLSAIVEPDNGKYLK